MTLSVIIVMLMNQITIFVALILLGLCFGSFAGASVWRLRARQLVQDKKDGEGYDENEYKKLHKIINKNFIKDRSKCLNCGYTLEWYDMIPLVSWLSLGGKCRKCKAKIGYLEPLMEVGVCLFFVLSYLLWPYSLNTPLAVTRLIIWLISGIVMAILFAYDKKWFLLPDIMNYLIIALGIINSLLIVIFAYNKTTALINIVGSVLILSGLYLLLYIVSKGRWIGFGDIKLGLGLALLLVDWKLAFIALFAANFIGCLIVIPAMIAGRLKRNSHVPFGPLLIVGTILAGLFGGYLVNMFFYTLV